MLSRIYFAIFIISIVMLVYLISTYGNRISVYYPLLFGAVSVCCLGFTQTAMGTNLQSVIFSIQVTYLGVSFAPFFLMMCIADLCKCKIPKFFRYIIALYASTVFLLVSSIGSTELYYKNLSLVQRGGASFLQHDYGPLHMMYPAYLAAVVLVILGIIINTFLRKQDVSFITTVSLLTLLFAVVILYAYERIAHLDVELLPFAYILSLLVILVLLGRVAFYDVVAVSADSMAKSSLNGFVIVDSRGRYYGADETAKEWFEEIRNLKIDKKIESENTDFLRQVVLWVKDESATEVELFERGDRIIEARHSIILKRNGEKNHCIFLRDETEQQKYTKLVEQYNENLERDVNEKTKKIGEIQNDIIVSMASIVENRDNNTGGHIKRTSDVIGIFVNHLKDINKYSFLDDTLAHNIIKAAPLHDFGKIAIPDDILNKPGKFSDEEYEVMKQHSAKGAAIVERILKNSEDIEFKKIATNVAHYHHEKWDGGGYPDHIKNDEIPFEARVMALADVFDALVSKRVYKESFSFDKAFEIIKESGGTHFDPELCEEFLNCRVRLEELFNSYDD